MSQAIDQAEWTKNHKRILGSRVEAPMNWCFFAWVLLLDNHVCEVDSRPIFFFFFRLAAPHTDPPLDDAMATQYKQARKNLQLVP